MEPAPPWYFSACSTHFGGSSISGIATIVASIPDESNHARSMADLSSEDHGFLMDGGWLDDPMAMISPFPLAFSVRQMSAAWIIRAWPLWTGWNLPRTTTPCSGGSSGGAGSKGRSLKPVAPKYRKTSHYRASTCRHLGTLYQPSIPSLTSCEIP